jgi:hypothetical protein
MDRYLGLDVNADADDLVLAAARAKRVVALSFAHSLCVDDIKRPRIAFALLVSQHASQHGTHTPTISAVDESVRASDLLRAEARVGTPV